MENYVLDFGNFAFENWWQVGLAASAVLLYVLYGVIPFVCLAVRSIFNRDAGYQEAMLASFALIPFIGIIAGAIFWEKYETMLKVGALLICLFCISFWGYILCSVGII